MKIGGVKKVSQPEAKLLGDIISLLLNNEIGINLLPELYKSAYEKLEKKLETDYSCSPEELMHSIGIANLADDYEIYLIAKLPYDIYKTKWDTLKIEWDQIWSPPEDDGLLIYIPNQKLILLTHWDTVYYN